MNVFSSCKKAIFILPVVLISACGGEDEEPAPVEENYLVESSETLFVFDYFDEINNRTISIPGVIALPDAEVTKTEGEGGLPWVVIAHGSGGMWSISNSQERVASPLDMSLGSNHGEGFSREALHKSVMLRASSVVL